MCKETQRKLTRIFKQTCVLSVEGGEMFDTSQPNEVVQVGFVHASNGYYPQSALSFSTYGNADQALEAAYELLETEMAELQDDTEREEREESIERGFDSLTEGWEGYSFSMTLADFHEVIEDIREDYEDLLSDVEFWDNSPEYDDGTR